MAFCTVEGCEGTRWARGYCNMHYLRWRKYGDTDLPGWSGSKSWKWTGDHPSYIAAHKRVWKQRGKASGYPCVTCGGPARHWAYVPGDYEELIDQKSGRPYSSCIDAYQPMCVSDHRLFDIRSGAVQAG